MYLMFLVNIFSCIKAKKHQAIREKNVIIKKVLATNLAWKDKIFDKSRDRITEPARESSTFIYFNIILEFLSIK